MLGAEGKQLAVGSGLWAVGSGLLAVGEKNRSYRTYSSFGT